MQLSKISSGGSGVKSMQIWTVEPGDLNTSQAITKHLEEAGGNRT